MTTANANPISLNYVLFFVSDIDASYDFFANTLGFKPDPSQTGDGFRQFFAGSDGATIGLFRAGEGTLPAGEVALYIGTPDIAALRETWTARGLAASPIVQMPFGKIFEVKTPDGLTLTPIQ